MGIHFRILLLSSLILAFPAAAQEAAFPALPPSRSCAPQDIKGIWKLMQVYEQPPGAVLQNFSSQPYQYIQFFKNSLFGQYGDTGRQGNKVVQRRLQNDAIKNQRQFVADKSGIVFFYEKSTSTGSLACFIVANPSGEFKKGQMLLMPPASADGKPPANKFVKIYERVQPPKKNANRNKRRK